MMEAIKSAWKNTVGKMIERKREQIKMKEEIRKEAYEEARPLIKEAIKNKMKDDMIKEATGEKKSGLAKIGEEFAAFGKTLNTEKVLNENLRGHQTTTNKPTSYAPTSGGMGSGISNDKITEMMGGMSHNVPNNEKVRKSFDIGQRGVLGREDQMAKVIDMKPQSDFDKKLKRALGK